MEPKVSVIIPVYNTQKYLAKCIESCVSQTLDGIEIIVINDGSTDASLEIAEHYAAEYDNVRVKSIENSGLSIARNTGLEMATGKYVYFLDSDDWLESNCFEELYTLAEKNILEIVTFDGKKEWENCKDDYCLSRSGIVDAAKIFSGREFAEKYKEANEVFVQAWTFFIRRDFLINHKIEFLPYAIYEDNKFYFDLLICCKRMMYCPEKLYVHLFRAGSIMTTSVSRRKLFSPFELVLGVFETIETAELCDEDRKFWWSYFILHRLQYLMAGFYHGINYQALKSILNETFFEVEMLQTKCIEKCFEIAKTFPISIDVMGTLFTFIQRILSGVGCCTTEQRRLLKNIEEYRKEYIKEKLERLPFSDEKKVIGIYGGGNHSSNILKVYEELVGKIKCKLICIDTYKESFTEKLAGMDIINVRDVDTANLDAIVISSYFYEKEMEALATVATGGSIPIYTLYQGAKYPLDEVPKPECELQKQILNYKEEYGKKRIYLMETPMHANTGDYMITYAEELFLKKNFPEHEVINVNTQELLQNKLDIINNISLLDIILVNGGGFFGTHWQDGDVLKMVLERFPYNKTVILPQTLYYETDNVGKKKAEKICEVIENHRALTICYRDAASLARGKEMFGANVKQYLFPDMVLHLNNMERKNKRDGIAVCLRKDAESIMSLEERDEVITLSKEISGNVHETSMHWHHTILPEDAERIINEKLDELGSVELVITDALHCMISCALVGTPCIALPNVTGKVGGVYEWVKELPYIRYIESAELVAEAMKEMFRNPNFKECNYDLRFEEYEQQLSELIGE